MDSKGVVFVAGTTTNGSFPVTSATSLQDFYSGGNTDGVFFSANDEAYKNAYVAVFQAWAYGTIKGSAEQIFDATKSILED